MIQNKETWKMSKNERVKNLRKFFNMSQEEFGKILGISKSGVSDIEAGRRSVTDQHIIMICQNPSLSPAVNPEWLREGTGEMFVESDEFSLDDFIKARGVTELETQIIKAYFELSPETRRDLIEHFKSRLTDPVKSAEEEYIKSRSGSAQKTGQSVSSIIDDERRATNES